MKVADQRGYKTPPYFLTSRKSSYLAEGVFFLPSGVCPPGCKVQLCSVQFTCIVCLGQGYHVWCVWCGVQDELHPPLWCGCDHRKTPRTLWNPSTLILPQWNLHTPTSPYPASHAIRAHSKCSHHYALKSPLSDNPCNPTSC